MTTKGHKLIAFDVDGTLLAHPQQLVVWQLLNNRFCRHGRVDHVRYDAFMEGHITYEEWVDLDVGDWMIAGATRAEMEQVVRDQLHLTPGAIKAVSELHDRGYLLAVISGTLDITIDTHFPEHPFSEVYTNRLLFDRRGLIRDWVATPYDMEGKALALQQMAQRLGIDLSETVFVGDNINDVYVMQSAGLAIAFQPKADEVRAVADVHIEHDLSDMLDVLRGYDE